MRSIERYLLGWLLGALGLGAAIIVLVTYFVTLDEMDEIFDADLKHVAESLGNYHHVGVALSIDRTRRLPLRTDVPNIEEIVTITWTHDGMLVYSSDPRVHIPFLNTEALTRVVVGAEEWIVYTDVSENGVAQAAQRLAARRESALETVSNILLPIAGVMVAIAGLMFFALRHGLRPLDDAARHIEERSAKSLDPMSAGEVPRELLPLVRAINNLLGKLADALAPQRRFLADAAHELRTPVTALRLQLQLLERASDDSRRGEAIAELHQGIDRAGRLVEQLLQVARSEPDGVLLLTESVDLDELVRSVVGSMSTKAEVLGIDLGAKADTHVQVHGDIEQLRVLLNNLVENALRYTPRGGVVDVESTLQDDHPTLRVIDNGPGIPEEERERVQDRFYRGQRAGAHEREPGGSGLGLSIVRAIAERHDAKVSLHDPPSGRGLDVRVTFPEATAQHPGSGY
jgi:two-component system OmpR family sensor kinase